MITLANRLPLEFDLISMERLNHLDRGLGRAEWRGVGRERRCHTCGDMHLNAELLLLEVA